MGIGLVAVSVVCAGGGGIQPFRIMGMAGVVFGFPVASGNSGGGGNTIGRVGACWLNAMAVGTAGKGVATGMVLLLLPIVETPWVAIGKPAVGSNVASGVGKGVAITIGGGGC